MREVVGFTLLTVFSVGAAGAPSGLDIPTSLAIKIAEIVAQDEGYDINDDGIYFDSLDSHGTQVDGFVTIGFYVNDHPRNTLSISESTGQVIDIMGCTVFDYPNLQPFADKIRKITGARKLTPQELAEAVGCESAKKVVTEVDSGSAD